MKTADSIDAMGSRKWMNALCPIYAEALHRTLGRGEFVGLFDHPNLPPSHVYLVHDERAYDFDHDGVEESVLLQARPHGSELQRRAADLHSIYIEVPKGPEMTDAYSYNGSEKQRWFHEAEALIKNNPTIQGILSQGK